jgi:hypothetical protein
MDTATTESTADQPSYALRIYRASSNQWSWEVSTADGPECGGGGYPDAFEAANAGVAELWQHIPDPAAPADPQPYERNERDYVHHATQGAVG